MSYFVLSAFLLAAAPEAVVEQDSTQKIAEELLVEEVDLAQQDDLDEDLVLDDSEFSLEEDEFEAE